MSEQEVNKKRFIRHWVENADEDYETMEVLYKSKRYSWSLFIGHLVIEKLLKAYYIQEKKEHPLFTHNLLRLAELSGLPLDETGKMELATITAFNINARYDDYKQNFRKKCTPEFTYIWIEKIKELRKWIKGQIKI